MTETNTRAKRAMPVWLSIILILIAFFIVTALFQFAGILIAGVSMDEIGNLQDMDVGFHLILSIWGLVPLVGLVYIFRKYVDRKSIISLGFSLKNKGIDWIAGLVMAVVIIGGGSLLLQSLGYVEFTKMTANTKMLLLSFALFIVVSVTEEVLIRGYILNNLLTVTNRYVALLISAAVFAGMHGFNFNLTWVAMLNLFLAGLVLGSTYIFTQNLWFPISLHLFWNFLQGPVLGYNVSGQNVDSLFSVTQQGNQLYHGGEFGFEGSVVCSVSIVLVTVLILIYYERKNKKQV